MEEIFFKPRYSFSYWFEFIFFLFWMSITGLTYFYGGELFSWSLVGFVLMTGSILFILSYTIRRIVFQQNALVIEYYFRPRREIEYREISDISAEAIWAGKFHLNTKEFANPGRLSDIIYSYKKSGQISESQFEGKLKKSEEIGRWAGIVAILGTILSVMTVPFILLIWFPNIKLDLSTIIEGSFVAIFLIAVAVLKIRARARG